jgi:hypothetical protein
VCITLSIEDYLRQRYIKDVFFIKITDKTLYSVQQKSESFASGFSYYTRRMSYFRMRFTQHKPHDQRRTCDLVRNFGDFCVF